MKLSIKWKQLIISLIIPLIAGGLSNMLTQNPKEFYNSLNLPGFAPPAIVFPIVWTLLYILMGISSYFIMMLPKKSTKNEALTSYYFQLGVNFFWSIIFFNTHNIMAAFWWLVMLIILVVVTIYRFFKLDKKAAYLLIPYFIWIIFAAVLNISIYILN